MSDPSLHHLQEGDVVEFKTGRRETDPTWVRGTVIGINHPEANDPTAFIRGPNGTKYARYASDVIFVERPAPPASEREILWKRQLTPAVALAVDDGLAPVLLVMPGKDRLPFPGLDVLKNAADDCRAYISFRKAVTAEWPNDPERVTEIVDSTWPMSD